MENGSNETNLSPESEESATVRPRVMVVDDQADARELVKRMLAKECDVVEAESGEDAWQKVQQDEGVVLMITDLRMPGLDGCDLIGRIRGSDDARVREMPVLLITGADGNEARQRAFVRGATGFIVKPIDINQLRALVGMYLRRVSVAQAVAPKSTSLAAQSAFVDPVTQLRSARFFAERGAKDFAFSMRLKSDLAIIGVEIEGFRELVKTRGRQTTDRMLVWLSELLLANTPADDTVARLVDAQFGILAMGADAQKAGSICDALQQAVAKRPFLNGKSDVPVALHFGFATLKQDSAKSLDALLKQALERMVPRDASPQMTASKSEEAQTGVAPLTIDMPFTAPDSETPLALSGAEHVPFDAPPLQNPSAAVEFQATALAVVVPEVEAGTPASPELSSFQVDMGEPAEVPAMLPNETSLPVMSPTLFELMSVDTAVMLMAHHQEALVVPYAEYLMQKIQPLLDYHRQCVDESVEKAGTR